MNIIGDVAGQYGALRRLVDKLPKDEEIILVGDLIDRGPYSPEVVQYCIDNNFTCLRGNHEDMMLDYYEKTYRYEDGLWQYNGGYATLKAYNERKEFNPYHHCVFLRKLPYYVIRDHYFVSHAPIPTNKRIDQLGVEWDLMWDREAVGKIIKGQSAGMKQIFGHNSHWGVKYFKYCNYDDGTNSWYALCIDSSRKDMITAYNTTEDKIYQENY